MRENFRGNPLIGAIVVDPRVKAAPQYQRVLAREEVLVPVVNGVPERLGLHVDQDAAGGVQLVVTEELSTS